MDCFDLCCGTFRRVTENVNCKDYWHPDDLSWNLVSFEKRSVIHCDDKAVVICTWLLFSFE